MKTKFIGLFSIAIFSMLIIMNAFAQKRDFTNEPAYNFSSKKNTNELSLNSNTSSFTNSNTSAETKDISKKALEYFNKKFFYANNVTWEPVHGMFLAKFSDDDTKTHILINKRGKIIYSIIFSGENKLPPDIKNMVNDAYKCYSITSVAKVEETDRQIWVVKLTNPKKYVTVVVEDGEINEIENYEKT